MESQVTNNANALRLFFIEDVFLVEDKTVKIASDATLKAVFQKCPIEINNKTEALPIDETDENKPGETGNTIKMYTQNADIPPLVEEPEVPLNFKFLGGNKKSVLILVNDSVNEVSTIQGRELLRKIVKAIDLTTPDFALVNYSNYHGTDFMELSQFFKPAVMLAFGVEAGHLRLNPGRAGEMIVHENTRIIFAPDLHHLDGDTTAKKLLWSKLQHVKV